MDVLKYNLVEKAPCEKVKSWARQHERDVCIYINGDGRLVINAMFSDGKSMWISTDTYASDVDINAEIIKVIQNTMEAPNYEWYAADCNAVYTNIKLSVTRRSEAVCLTVLLRQTEYRDIDGEWQNYTDNTSYRIAEAVYKYMEDARNKNSNFELQLRTLAELEEKLNGFSTDAAGWHYNFSKIEPALKEIEKCQFMKISTELKVRCKYNELSNRARRIYNEYQSLAR